jgi:hypothetical protein
MKYTNKWMVVPFDEEKYNIFTASNLSNNDNVHLYNKIEFQKNNNKKNLTVNNNVYESNNKRYIQEDMNKIDETTFETNSNNKRDEVLNESINDEEIMEVDKTIRKNFDNTDIKDTIKRKITNAKNEEEKITLMELLKDIEINENIFKKGFDERIIRPVFKNTRSRILNEKIKNLEKRNNERRNINKMNDSLFKENEFDEENSNIINDQPIKFNLEIPENWEFLNEKNNLNQDKKVKRLNKNVTKKKKKSILKANSSLILHQRKNKKTKIIKNINTLLKIPEVQNIFDNETKKK